MSAKMTVINGLNFLLLVLNISFLAMGIGTPILSWLVVAVCGFNCTVTSWRFIVLDRRWPQRAWVAVRHRHGSQPLSLKTMSANQVVLHGSDGRQVTITSGAPLAITEVGIDSDFYRHPPEAGQWR